VRRRGRTRRARARGRRIGPIGRRAARRRARSRARVRVGLDADAAARRASRRVGARGGWRVGRTRGLGRARVHLHLRHASTRRRSAAAARAAGAHRGDGCPRWLARLDPTCVDRRATGLGLRASFGAGSCDRRRGASGRRGAAGRGRGHVGSGSDRRRGTWLRVASHVVASGSDRHRSTTGLVGRIAWLRGRSDVAVACRDDARSRSTTTIGARRWTSTGRPTWVGVWSVARPPVMRRMTICMPPVMTDAAPIPTAPVVADAPAIGDPWIVVVPDPDQRRGRAVVVGPRIPVRIPEHERALDIVVPTAGPVDAWERLDRLGVRVHVRDDHDLIAARQRLVADGLGRIVAGRRCVVLVLHVDVGVRDVRRRQVAGLIVWLLVVGRPRRGVRRRVGGGSRVLRAASERNQSEQGTGDQDDSRRRHVLSVPRTRPRYNPADPAPRTGSRPPSRGTLG
jgi:hypothetical protein